MEEKEVMINSLAGEGYNLENKIIIKNPYIDIYTHANGETLHRLNAEIIENGQLHHLFVEVKEEYGKYLCSERSDAFLYLVLPVAMREKYDIYCEAPVTDQLLHNINEILIPHLVKGDSRLYASKIHCQTETKNICGEAVGTAISCGVDSMYTVMECTNGNYPSIQLTHLYIASLNAELWDTKNATIVEWIDNHKTQFDRFQIVSDELKLPIVAVYSNFFDYLCSRSWKEYHHLYVHQYISLGSVLALKKLWKMYFFSSSMDFTNFKLKDNKYDEPDKYDLLTVHVLSETGFSCYCGGAKSTRIEKTKALADYPLAQKALHPCHSPTKMNCSMPTCPKCLRGLLVFDYYNKLDQMSNVFDINKYRKTKSNYFIHLTRCKDNEFFSQLYNMMQEKYPVEMEKAEKDYEKLFGPISRAVFNNVKKLYDITLDLLSIDNPKQFFNNFFKNKNINTLYTSGTSLIGNKVIELIKNDITIKSQKTGTINECDAAFILMTTEAEIKGAQNILKNNGCQKIYSIFDIHKEYLASKKNNLK